MKAAQRIITKPDKLSLGAVLLVLIVSYFWGLGIVGSKLALKFFTPFAYSGFRFLIASLFLLAVAFFTGQPMPKKKRDWAGLGLLGFLHTTLLYSFLYTGMDYITAGKTIVILNSQPFWVALAAPLFLLEKRFNLAMVAGLLLGFIGVSVIFIKDILQFNPADLRGGGLVLLAALSWTAGTIYAKRLMLSVPPLVTVALQMFLGSLPLLVLGGVVPYEARLGLGLVSAALLVGLAIFCSCTPYFLWFWLLKRYPSGILSSFNFLQIIFSVAMAYPILGETVGLSLVVGAALVSLGIYMVNRF